MAQVKGFWMALKKKGNLPQDPEEYDTGMGMSGLSENRVLSNWNHLSGMGMSLGRI